MPRKALTKEKFSSVSITASDFDELHSMKRGKSEPIYITFHRVLRHFRESDVNQVDFWESQYEKIKQEAVELRSQLDSMKTGIQSYL